jgi:hypothetical protein
MALPFVVAAVVRFAHVGGAIALVGALLWSHWSGVATPRRYAWLLGLSALALALSGAVQYGMHLAVATPAWHAIAGLKIVLALHVLAVAVLLARRGQEEAKRARLTRGALFSGWLVVLLGAILHTL